MVVNPALILVSALFFLALVSVFYLIAWGAASAALSVGRGRLAAPDSRHGGVGFRMKEC